MQHFLLSILQGIGYSAKNLQTNLCWGIRLRWLVKQSQIKIVKETVPKSNIHLIPSQIQIQKIQTTSK